MSQGAYGYQLTHCRSKSLIPLTRFCVYCTISENRKAKAAPETSALRVLFKFRSYILGRLTIFLAEAAAACGNDGSENLDDIVVGDSRSVEE